MLWLAVTRLLARRGQRFEIYDGQATAARAAETKLRNNINSRHLDLPRARFEAVCRGWQPAKTGLPLGVCRLEDSLRAQALVMNTVRTLMKASSVDLI